MIDCDAPARNRLENGVFDAIEKRYVRTRCRLAVRTCPPITHTYPKHGRRMPAHPVRQVRKIVFSIYLDPTDPTVRTGPVREPSPITAC